MKKNPENLRLSASQKGFTPLKKYGGEVSGEIKLFRMPFQWNLFRKSSSLTGFTLLEVLVAMVILSVGLLGMASLTASIIRNNSFSDDFTTATALVQDKLESIANATWDASQVVNGVNTVIIAGHILLYDDPAVANNTINTYTLDAVFDYQDVNINQCGTTDCTAASTCTIVSGHCKFTRTWNIWDRTDLSAPDPATRKDIAVIVSWTSDLGNTKTITMTTIKIQTDK